MKNDSFSLSGLIFGLLQNYNLVLSCDGKFYTAAVMDRLNKQVCIGTGLNIRLAVQDARAHLNKYLEGK